jgi:hypothetical protein
MSTAKGALHLIHPTCHLFATLEKNRNKAGSGASEAAAFRPGSRPLACKVHSADDEPSQLFWRIAMLRPRKMPRLWRIDIVSEQKTKCLGVVTAPDEEVAIKRACEKFVIEGPNNQRQLVARELSENRDK